MADPEHSHASSIETDRLKQELQSLFIGDNAFKCGINVEADVVEELSTPTRLLRTGSIIEHSGSIPVEVRYLITKELIGVPDMSNYTESRTEEFFHIKIGLFSYLLSNGNQLVNNTEDGAIASPSEVHNVVYDLGETTWDDQPVERAA